MGYSPSFTLKGVIPLGGFLMKKITLLICLVIILNAPISAFAQATSTTPTVTIAAGTGAAVGGAYQGYTSKTAAAATALTLAVLSATGAAVKLTEASVQAGKTVYQVINDKFAQWVGGTSAEELSSSQAEELQSRFKVITGGGGNQEDPDNNQDNGTNVGVDGKLWFSPASLSMLKQFCDWLESTDQLNNYQVGTESDNPVVNLGEISTVVNTQCYIYNAQTGYVDAITSNKDVACFVGLPRNGLYYNLFVIGNEPFNYGGNFSGSAPSYHGYYYATLSTGIGRPDIYPVGACQTGLNVYQVIDSITQWNVQDSSQTVIDNDGIYKGENYNSDILRNPNNQIFVVDPGILNGFNVDSDRQITIPDYLELIIQQAEEKAKREAQPDPSPAPQELPVPLLDPITGTKSPANWIDPAPEDAIQDPVESEKRDPDPEDPKDPVIDDDTPTDPEDAVELLKVDLTKIFPFCLPWDIYRILEKFNADPVTPTITIDWGNILGSIGVDFETTLDLHDYDGVAYVLRTMETVAFVVGLAVATKSIFLGS